MLNYITYEFLIIISAIMKVRIYKQDFFPFQLNNYFLIQLKIDEFVRILTNFSRFLCSNF